MSKADRFTKMFSVTWSRLHEDTRILANELLDKGPFKGIVAVTRGGLIPAGILARELDIHLIDTLCLSSYNWKEQGELKVLKHVEGDGAGWLIVDDLVDTGGTAKVIRELLPKAYFATVYAKPKGRPMVDTCITEVSQDTWILFPWDSQIQYVTPLVSQEDES